MQNEFFYRNGDLVRVGDRVLSVAGRSGVIHEILMPGTEVAKQLLYPDGGVLLMENWDGVFSPRVIAIPGDLDWDDVILVERINPI